MDQAFAHALTRIVGKGDAPWVESEGRAGAVRRRFLGESWDKGPWILQIRFEPGYQEPPHWHDFDTIYIPTKGEMRIGDEGVVGVGDVRWVRAGTRYGPEAAGPEGCEFYLISYGPLALHTDDGPGRRMAGDDE